jgi:hypothetical protein
MDKRRLSGGAFSRTEALSACAKSKKSVDLHLPAVYDNSDLSLDTRPR